MPASSRAARFRTAGELAARPRRQSVGRDPRHPGLRAAHDRARRPGLIINTGSKQGITTPPGNPAYNVSKAGVKAFTEALQHELRNTPGARSARTADPRLRLHRADRARPHREAGRRLDAGADRRLHDRALDAGDFYILCPDNDVPRALDERRMLWAVGDIVENRPPLSRWHPDYAEAFAEFVKGG